MQQAEMHHISALEKKIDDLGKSVQEIRSALIGSDLTNKQGIVHDLADHEKRITTLEKRVDGAKTWLIGVGFGLGIAGYKIADIVFHSLKS